MPERDFDAPEEALIEAFLARELPAEGDGGAGLRRLAAALEAEPTPEPHPAVVARTLHRARAELAAEQQRRELLLTLGRLLAATALPVLLALAWNVALLQLAPPFLANWLPPAVAWALVGAYAFGSAGWLALLYGSLPALAHRSVARRQREAL